MFLQLQLSNMLSLSPKTFNVCPTIEKSKVPEKRSNTAKTPWRPPYVCRLESTESRAKEAHNIRAIDS